MSFEGHKVTNGTESVAKSIVTNCEKNSKHSEFSLASVLTIHLWLCFSYGSVGLDNPSHIVDYHSYSGLVEKKKVWILKHPFGDSTTVVL